MHYYSMEELYVRGCYENPFADAKYSGHVEHLNGCCTPEEPCEGVDPEDYVLGSEGEWVYHPVDGVCAVKVYFDEDEIIIDQTYAVLGNVYLFEGEEIPSFDVYDGVFVMPTKIVAGPFESAIEVEEFIRRELL